MIPLYDRYSNNDSIKELNNIFGERNYLKKCYEIEVHYFCVLSQHSNTNENRLLSCYDYDRIKEIEQTTNHDIMAVVKFLEEVAESNGFNKIWNIHFGLTSQDIVSLANVLMNIEAQELANQKLGELDFVLRSMLGGYTIMGYTHGQKALPISTDHIISTLISRLKDFGNISYSRFGNGAIGNNFSQKLLESINGVSFIGGKSLFEGATLLTIEDFDVEKVVHHQQTDYYPTIVDTLSVIEHNSVVLEDFCKDIWRYISMGIIAQEIDMNQTGSSTMAHKTNPIKFENAEGNFNMCHNTATTIKKKLLCSRFERDLSDITVIRNVPLVWSYYLLGLTSLIEGIKFICINTNKVDEILNNSYEVLAEFVNLALRLKNVPNAYELSKKMFKNKSNMNEVEFKEIIRESGFFTEEEISKIKIK